MSAKNLMAVDVKTNGPKFEWGTARPLFEPRLEADLRMTRYLVAPDGQKFLVNMPLRGSSASPVTVVSNWTAALTK